ncbi:hypothetical protein EDD27_3873 [Nonomuraea polychroma]|uniref:Alpha-L-rhamnosidase six-hairpin glycosidase domain-containing protein n=1 Tax=Nonomuraea polychroma TaxID=46176 RepID=A0A438M6M6_9ACTN|nr:hypothetical protein [Nonomuraea polychroma]RVX41352.1 hypothetical protein EDD27_3873 [Nonomuraea polychroma]
MSHTIDFRFAPPSRWTAICLPDDPHKTLVREDGALLYGFTQTHLAAWHFATVVEFSAQTADRPVSVTQRTESAARPIVVTTMRYPRLELTLTAFAHEHDGFRADVVMWELTHIGDDGEVLTGLHIDHHDRDAVLTGGTTPFHVAYSVAPEQAPAQPIWVDDTAEQDGTPLGPVALVHRPQRLHLAHPTGFRPATGLDVTPEILRPGGRTGGALVLPQPAVAETPAIADLAWAEAALTRARAFWDELPALRLPITVPDPAVQDLLVACVRNLLQAREIRDGLPVPQVGATVYRGLWIVDGHFILEAARYLGFAADADAGVRVLLRRARPDGSITGLELAPHIKETAIAIATLVRQSELSADPRGALSSHWPVVLRAIDHIAGLRRQADALPTGHPLHGLMPPAFADGGVAGVRAEYTTTLWTLAGLRAAVRGATMLGRASDRDAIHAQYLQLRANFDTAARRHREEGLAYLPMIHPESGSHHYHAGPVEADVAAWHRIRPGSATWALCQAIWPGEVFEPGDHVVTDLLALFDALDDEQGIPAETGWLPYRAVWPYAASFAAHAWLYAGRADKAVDYLYAFANHAAPTRVWREEQSLTVTGNGQLWGDMPHNWASAEFVRLVRHLLLFERDDTLELLPAVPAGWFGAGQTIELERSTTRFGPVSLHVTTEHTDVVTVTVRYTRQGDSHPAPDRLSLSLPLPEGAAERPTEITVDGRVVPPADGRIPLATVDDVTVRMTYRRLS